SVVPKALAINARFDSRISVHAVGTFASEKDAEDFKTLIQASQSMLRMNGQFPGSGVNFLQNLKLTTDGKNLVAKTTTDAADIIGLVQGLGRNAQRTFDKVADKVGSSEFKPVRPLGRPIKGGR